MVDRLLLRNVPPKNSILGTSLSMITSMLYQREISSITSFDVFSSKLNFPWIQASSVSSSIAFTAILEAAQTLCCPGVRNLGARELFVLLYTLTFPSTKEVLTLLLS